MSSLSKVGPLSSCFTCVGYLLSKGDSPVLQYMYIEIPLDAQKVQEVTSR